MTKQQTWWTKAAEEWLTDFRICKAAREVNSMWCCFMAALSNKEREELYWKGF